LTGLPNKNTDKNKTNFIAIKIRASNTFVGCILASEGGVQLGGADKAVRNLLVKLEQKSIAVNIKLFDWWSLDFTTKYRGLLGR
jgi:hypothetical protein